MLLEWKWVFPWNTSSINIACNFCYVSPIISWHFAYHSGYAVTVAKPFHLEDLVAWNSALRLQQREFREKCNFPETLANGGWMPTRNDAKEIWGMRETVRETFCSVAIQAVPAMTVVNIALSDFSQLYSIYYKHFKEMPAGESRGESLQESG